VKKTRNLQQNIPIGAWGPWGGGGGCVSEQGKEFLKKLCKEKNVLK